MSQAEAARRGGVNSSIQWTPRRVIFVAGMALWLGAMLVQTRGSGIVALWTAALVLGGLLIVSIPTRTVTLGQMIEMLCLGGAMLGIAILAGAILDGAYGPGTTRLRNTALPILEEVLKILPLVWFLWRQRDGRAQSLGVTDVLLLAAAAGLGFGLVEDAFMRQSYRGSWGTLWWLPTSIITTGRSGMRLIAGHDPWTALAGLTMGFALLLRRPRLQTIVIAASGLVWAIYGPHREQLRDSLP